MNKYKLFNLVLVFVFLFSLGGKPTTVLAQEPNPTFGVRADEDRIEGWGWPEAATVAVTIADTTGTLYTETASVYQITGKDPPLFAFDLNLKGKFDIKPDQTVTVTDGTTTKDTVVTALAVTSVDVATDIVFGKAAPGTPVDLWICDGSGCANRHVAADGSGVWSANFAVVGAGDDEKTTYDIVPGTKGDAMQSDADGDGTMSGFYVPEPPNPTFNVRANDDTVDGWGWTSGTTVTVMIGDPATPDYTGTALVSDVSQKPGETWFNLNLKGLYDLVPDQTVTVTDGTTTKQTVVTVLAVTGIEVATDVVSGVADKNARVDVWVCDNFGCANRHVTADGGGVWSANFAVLGTDEDEKTLYDIVPGTKGDARQSDADGDGTMFGFYVPNPYVEAAPYSNWIHARDWPIRTQITLEIDNPADGLGDSDTDSNPVDYSATAHMQQAPWNPGDPNDIVADFRWPAQFAPGPGYIITMTGNGQSKTLTVSALKITGIDTAADTVSGIGTPDVQTQVCINIPNRCITRWVTPDSFGNWTANYYNPGTGNDDPETFDLKPGDNGWAAEYDGDSDRTWYDWRVLNPYIEASPNSRWIQARDWPVGTELTLTIDDPSNGPDVDHTGTAVVAQNPDNPGDPNDILAKFAWPEIGLQPGFILTVTGGGSSKVLVISTLAVTAVDPVLETVSGEATPGAKLHVCANIPYNCITRWVTADSSESGLWTADYSVAGLPPDDPATLDLAPGSNGWVYQDDMDGDHTWVDWSVPNPIVEANLLSNRVQGRDWPMGAAVTLTIDIPGNGIPVDYTAGAIFGQNPENPGDPKDLIALFNLKKDFILAAGDVVTLTDGTTTRSLTVSSLAVTGIDPAANTISGIAEPDVKVDIWACDKKSCTNLWTSADENGDWLADFGQTGPDPITPGAQGGAGVRDSLGNQTWADWRVPNPSFSARPEPNEEVEAYEWPLHSTVTVSIDDPATVPDVDYTASRVVEVAPWDSSQTYAFFGLNNIFDIQPGFVVSLTDGTTTKTHTVTNLSFTEMNVAADTVSGVANPNARVDVWACPKSGDCVNRSLVADLGGAWWANFAEPDGYGNPALDLVYGMWVDSQEWDEFGDRTMFGSNIPNPPNQPPLANAGPDISALEGSPVTLDGSASSDPDGDPLAYDWDLDNDGLYDDAAGLTTSITFPDNGTFTVGLRVTDPFGLSGSDTAQIMVANVAPIPEITQAAVNNLGVLTATGSFVDPGADVWTATVRYGDGTGVKNLTLNPDKSFSLSHTYAHNGAYTVKVCVGDDDGGSGCDQVQVKVFINRPPVANAGGPYFATEGSSVTLNASKSTDPEHNIVLYEWDLDADGQFDDATGITPRFTAFDNGVFTVRVRVTDAGGLSSVAAATVTVKNSPPVITSFTITGQVRVGTIVNARVAFKDAGVYDTFTALWNWGDGSTTSGSISNYAVAGSHAYAKKGDYIVTITITDKDGGVARASRVVLVSNR